MRAPSPHPDPRTPPHVLLGRAGDRILAAVTESIFHLLSPDEWAEAEEVGVRIASSLEDEGFLHASTRDQLQATANRTFRGRGELVVLVVDPDRLDAELRWERATDVGEDFPHIYGPLNLEAVLAAWEYREGAEGYGPPPG